MMMPIEWGGFLEHAIREYPKEACGFLFSEKPYSENERWLVFIVKNIAENPEEAWIPDKIDMAKAKAQAVKMGLIKIGNVHTHPYYDEWLPYNEDKMQEIIQPSDKDLSFARKFNDIVRIIVCVGKGAIYDCYVHDKFGKQLEVKLDERKVRA